MNTVVEETYRVGHGGSLRLGEYIFNWVTDYQFRGFLFKKWIVSSNSQTPMYHAGHTLQAVFPPFKTHLRGTTKKYSYQCMLVLLLFRVAGLKVDWQHKKCIYCHLYLQGHP